MDVNTGIDDALAFACVSSNRNINLDDASHELIIDFSELRIVRNLIMRMNKEIKWTR